MEVIHLKSTDAEVSTLGRIAGSKAYQLVVHDHSPYKTPISRWLAVNRRRHAAKFRHTNLDLVSVGPPFSQVDPNKYGYALIGDQFWRVHANEAPVLIKKSEVPTLTKGCYLLWRVA